MRVSVGGCGCGSSRCWSGGECPCGKGFQILVYIFMRNFVLWILDKRVCHLRFFLKFTKCRKIITKFCEIQHWKPCLWGGVSEVAWLGRGVVVLLTIRYLQPSPDRLGLSSRPGSLLLLYREIRKRKFRNFPKKLQSNILSSCGISSLILYTGLSSQAGKSAISK